MERKNSPSGNALVSYVWQIYINGEKPGSGGGRVMGDVVAVFDVGGEWGSQKKLS